MIIILEGCDKTGKTTLAKELEGRGFTYKHFSAPPKGQRAADQYIEFLKTTAHESRVDYVLDRFHLGELVYPQIFGRESSMTQQEFERVEKMLHEQGALVIHCTDAPSRIAIRFMECKEESAKSEQIVDIVSGFANAFAATTLPGFTYRIGDAINPIIELIKSY